MSFGQGYECNNHAKEINHKYIIQIQFVIYLIEDLLMKMRIKHQNS
jgi:hypothetical protein